MSFRKRLLRIFAILLLVALFAGYFAFSTFLFSPLEGDLEADVSTLVPRDVDFFVAKAHLDKDFSPFPRPAVIDALEPTFGWHTFEESETYAQWAARMEGPLGQIEQIRSRLRGLDLLDIFGGRDLAVAGYFFTPPVRAAFGVNLWGPRGGVRSGPPNKKQVTGNR